MDSRLVNYMLECITNYIKTGIEEEPNRFKYTIYADILVDKLDINLPTMDEMMFNKTLKEFISYLRWVDSHKNFGNFVT